MTQPMALIGKKKIDILHTPAENVVVDDKLVELSKKMIATVRKSYGHALAAVQVGIPINLVVTHGGQTFLNIEIDVDEESDIITEPEGCLSLPGRIFEVPRFSSIEFNADTLDGERVYNEFKDFEARIWQHENDHLLGKLISEGGYEPHRNLDG
jgi:peptide deformylase